MSKRVIGVSQLNEYLNGVIDSEDLLKGIGVRGEISNFKQSGASAFFTLKDAESRIECYFYNYREAAANKSAPDPDGMLAVVTGNPSFSPRSGRLMFNAREIEAAGQGDLFKQFIALKERLEKDGVFSRQIPLPKDVRKIGVVTSRTGAVIRDIVSVARRRDPSVHIVLMPARVQGTGAEAEICEAVRALDASGIADVIVVARGGGSFADLAPFNTEAVARCVAACRTPVVSAVGHETDFTLCDFASDLRAPTPSAAAELVTKEAAFYARDLLNLLRMVRARAVYAAESAAARCLQTVRGFCSYKGAAPENALEILAARLANSPPARFREGYFRLVSEGKYVKGSDELRAGAIVAAKFPGADVIMEVKEVMER
ncbi:MAG: exodeoxyribonuclease VII large subunit [Firmicutes bacterium]|nr:exodeoxyribonuclease VII large subunit [Bacillota bacterium]